MTRAIVDRSRSRDDPQSVYSKTRQEIQTRDRWEPYGSNRGGKGAPRGSLPRGSGPDGPGSWRHDLFDDAANHGGQVEVDLPPRGMGSGRGIHSRASGGGFAVAVRNLDSTVKSRDLQQLFAKIGDVADARVDDSGTGYVEFYNSEDAAQAVRRFHRHPWKGGRPLNVAVRGGQNVRRW